MDQRATIDELRRLAARRQVPDAGKKAAAGAALPGPGGAEVGGAETRQDNAKPPSSMLREAEGRDDRPQGVPLGGSRQKPSKLVYAVPLALLIGVVGWGAWMHWGTSR